MNNDRALFSEPQIGYYHAECCLLDLYRIDTQEQLEAVRERIADNDECGPLMVFATLAEAVAYLAPNSCDREGPHEAEALKRLGWQG